MSILLWFLLASCTVVLVFYLYRRFWVHQYLARLGIPGPKPHWLFGNLLSLASEGERHFVLAEWTKKYGSIYGYYEGPDPVLMISDLDALSNVFVKQFANFHARKMFHYQPDPDDPNEPVSVFFARGDRWKRLRTIINPAFTSKKMKEMTPQMQQYQRHFMELVAKKGANETSFNVFELFQLLTMDTIGECAFGIALNSIKSEGRDNPTLKRVQEMLEMTFKLPIITVVTMFLTELKPLFNIWVQGTKNLSISMYAPTLWMFSVIQKLLNERKRDTNNRPNDLLQLMLDGEEATSQIVNEKSASTYTKAGSVLKALTPEEIKAQVFIFLIAGYETTSNVLALTAYELSLNSEIQNKLIKEIDDSFCDSIVEPDYDSLSAKNLPYLDAVVNEALRMYPVGLFVSNRIAMEDTNLCGYRIPKGLVVQPEVMSVHFDPQTWGPVDPKQFHPERWLPDCPTNDKNREIAFLTFGAGPRTCIGMRFALLEMKMTLVNMLRRYRIERCDRTEVPLQLKVAHTMTPKNGIWIKLKERVK